MCAKNTSSYRWKYGLALTVLAAGYLLFYLFPRWVASCLFCPFKSLTGLPCPACGSTRATLQLLAGDGVGALLTNPLVVLTHLALIGSAIWMGIDLIQGRETFLPAMQKRWKPVYLIPLLVLFAANMWWNYRKGL